MSRPAGAVEVSALLGLGDQQPTFDFTNELQRALQHAPFQHLTEEGATADNLAQARTDAAPYKDRPDSHLVPSGPFIKKPYGVVTRNPAAYSHLLRQAILVGEVLPVHDPLLDDAVQIIVEHELDHATVMEDTSPCTAIYYGVELVLVDGPDGYPEPAVSPALNHVGLLRKIDLALVNAAPDILSPTDLASIEALGYSSAEEVRQRYVALPDSQKLALSGLNIAYRGLMQLKSRAVILQSPK
jgi:hypothetical protein